MIWPKGWTALRQGKGPKEESQTAESNAGYRRARVAKFKAFQSSQIELGIQHIAHTMDSDEADLDAFEFNLCVIICSEESCIRVHCPIVELQSLPEHCSPAVGKASDNDTQQESQCIALSEIDNPQYYHN